MKKELLFLGFLSIAVFTSAQSTSNGHEYVDLGLSVRWATCNVGATKPEEFGGYFAWGETTPKSQYTWGTYKWCNGDSHSLTKYNYDRTLGKVDNKTTLEAADDAAKVNWGGVWRMPTPAEMNELIDKCTWEKKLINGIWGYKVTGPNGNSIFLPEAGSCWCTVDDETICDGATGLYWTNSLYMDDGGGRVACNANYLGCYSGYDIARYTMYGGRYEGKSIRPVLP